MVIRLENATLDDCLSFAGGRVMLRKYMVLQHQAGDAVLISDDEGPLAIAFLAPDGEGRREFSLGIRPRARARMRELCRAAQLILGRMAEDGPIICHVVPENRQGARMARIVGFRPDPDHRYRWIMEPGNDVSQKSVRRREQRHDGPRQGTAAAGGGDQ